MNTGETTARFDVGSKISTLWIVVLFNMVFADIVGFMNPGALEGIIRGATGFGITQGLLVVFIEIALMLLIVWYAWTWHKDEA